MNTHTQNRGLGYSLLQLIPPPFRRLEAIGLIVIVFGIAAVEVINARTTWLSGISIAGATAGIICLAYAALDLIMIPRTTLKVQHTREGQKAAQARWRTFLVGVVVGAFFTYYATYQIVSTKGLSGTSAILFSLASALVLVALRFLAWFLFLRQIERFLSQGGVDAAKVMTVIADLTLVLAVLTFLLFEFINGYTNFVAFGDFYDPSTSFFWAIALFALDNTFLVWRIMASNGDEVDDEIEHVLWYAFVFLAFLGALASARAIWDGEVAAGTITIIWQMYAFSLTGGGVIFLSRYLIADYIIKNVYNSGRAAIRRAATAPVPSYQRPLPQSRPAPTTIVPEVLNNPPEGWTVRFIQSAWWIFPPGPEQPIKWDGTNVPWAKITAAPHYPSPRDVEHRV